MQKWVKGWGRVTRWLIFFSFFHEMVFWLNFEKSRWITNVKLTESQDVGREKINKRHRAVSATRGLSEDSGVLSSPCLAAPSLLARQWSHVLHKIRIIRHQHCHLRHRSLGRQSEDFTTSQMYHCWEVFPDAFKIRLNWESCCVVTTKNKKAHILRTVVFLICS